MPIYRAKHDTMIAGKPTAKDVEVKGLSEDRIKAYLEAGLIEEVKPEKVTKEAAKVEDDFAKAAKEIDRTSDKRVAK